jgi:cell division protein FtsB
MNELELRATAIAREISNQRAFLGDRAANLAADNAMLLAEVEKLKARIAELEKPQDSGQSLP